MSPARLTEADERPLCECHGEPKRKNASKRNGTTYWICRVKYRESNKRWRDDHQAQRRAYMARYREEHRQDLRDWQASYRAAHPKHWRPRVMMQKYGLTTEDLRDLLIGQAGRCLVCQRVPSDDLVVDHNHATGRVRGLLCQKCNRMLGHVADDPRILRSAIHYLQVAG